MSKQRRPRTVEVCGFSSGRTADLKIGGPRYLLAAEKQFLVTAEEGTESGGFGAHVAALLHDRKIPTSILRIALPDRIIPHGAPNLLHAKYGLDADGIVDRIKAYADECPMRAELKYRSLLHP